MISRLLVQIVKKKINKQTQKKIPKPKKQNKKTVIHFIHPLNLNLLYTFFGTLKSVHPDAY